MLYVLIFVLSMPTYNMCATQMWGPLELDKCEILQKEIPGSVCVRVNGKYT